MAVAIEETLGNCPKYLNRKTVWSHLASPRLVSDSLPLAHEAVELIGRSDIFFLSSRHGAESMDTNNRGGAPGFVRVFSNSTDEGVSLVYPEYSGNRLFQTLGNLQTDPAVGITFPDFETGDVLYLTGRAEVLIGAEATAVLPHSKVAVKVTVEAARFVSEGLPFRGRLLDPSPYNPPVRQLAREIRATDEFTEAIDGGDGRSRAIAMATLIRSSRITPTVSRHTFRLSPDPSSSRAKEEFSRLALWRPGQHVTLDFSAHLDRGWSHMRDHDPTSLNDDYIRSFTISSAPVRRSAQAHADRPDSLDGVEFDITVRKHGPVTRFLTRWVPGSELTVPVLEFEGEEDLQAPDEDLVVVAGGIGITPFMAHVGRKAESEGPLSLLWSLRADDLPLAVDLLDRTGRTGLGVSLFVTGAVDAGGQSDLQTLARLGADIHTRRIRRNDVVGAGTEGRRRFRVCTGAGLRRSLLEWLDGEHVSVVNFDY
jgi:ferredoxin-NADP reductase